MLTMERPSWWRIRRSVVIGILVAYLAVLVLLVIFTSRLIFLPPAEVSHATPARLGLAFEDLRIPVGGNGYAHAWWIPAKVKTSTVMIYFHGNAEVLEDEVDQEVPVFRKTGANLLMVDFRGYGRSSPLRTNGASAIEDAVAAMRYLQQERGVAVSDVVICGWSIGSAVATQLAAVTPGARGLVLISPISSVADVANRDWRFRYPLRPAQLFLGANRLDTAGKIGAIHMPVLILAGSMDDLAEPWMAHKIYDRANEPKSLQFIEGAGHTDIMEGGDGTLERRLTAFINRSNN